MSVSFPFLEVAFDMLASPELVDFLGRWNVDLDRMDMESLKRTLAVIQTFYDEAEVKQFTNRPVKLWLDSVKQLLYDVEDTLDDYLIELLRLIKLESQSHHDEQISHPHQTQQVHYTLPLTPTDETSTVLSLLISIIESALMTINESFGLKVRDINEKLKSVKQEGVALNLGLNSSMGSGSSRPRIFSQRPPTSSLVIRSKVFGRDDDMWKIIKWLLPAAKTPNSSYSDNDDSFSVLPIVGMGGIGKTTLAQLVFNHERVENSKYFDLKAWVCVSEDFDVVRLTKEIVEAITHSSVPSNSLDELQMKLKMALSKKRFLLVLDDMWTEDHQRWETLSMGFAFGRPGSKILVTTRNKGVASMVSTVENVHDLKRISDDDCLELLRRHAFKDGNSSDANEKLEAFGQEFVKKCKGLPLAMKTLASLLRGKRENGEWEDILENEIWDLTDSDILPSLMLSYHHLPPLLKRCLAYCALFPKDYVFEKIELVMLWMAEGIVQPKSKGRKRVEDIGAGYFDELVMRSFFELSSNRSPTWTSTSVTLGGRYEGEDLFSKFPNKFHFRSFFKVPSNTGSGFVMHDMIHDLVQVVSDGIYRRMEECGKLSKVLTGTRHFSYLIDDYNVEMTESKAMKSLRTFLDLKYCRVPFIVFPAKQFQFLRVLRIRAYHKDVLPDSIGNLKHLRLLDLSFCGIVRLSDSITSLHNLQTLILTGCMNLREFPKDMSDLINLRHLVLPLLPHQYDKMPLMGVRNLTSLQTLSIFVMGSNDRSELRDLSQLRGTITISIWENNGTEAAMANLKNKPHLVGLRLWWRIDNESKDSLRMKDEKLEEDVHVLDRLQPHTNLEALWIEDYGGMRFPNWIEYPSCFSNLETVALICCKKCKFVPHLRQLPFLKHLHIYRCSAVKSLGTEFNGDGSSSSPSANKQFRSLETLLIEYMEEWEEWPQVLEEEEEEEGGVQFPCLRKLIIKHCPKLGMFSHRFPLLEELEIFGCDNLREIPRLLPSLQQLDIALCPKLVVFPTLPSIERLLLSNCLQLTTILFDFGHPSSAAAAATTSAPHVQNSFHSLRHLQINICDSIRELPGILPSLESLWIKGCKELCSLPMLPSIKNLKLQSCKGRVLNNRMVPRLSSLLSLTIEDVSDLESLPNRFMQQLAALQILEISHCPQLTVLLQNEIGVDHLLPSSLQRLSIHDCDDNLKKLPQKGLHNLTSLRVIHISRCENLESLPKDLHSLVSLQEFVIQGCPVLVFFPETRLPTALQRLRIRDCECLESLPMGLLHNLTSLQFLALSECPKLKALSEGLNKLTSLQSLEIKECPALESFPDMGLPTELQELVIKACGKLHFLPKELQKLTNLQTLKLVECPSLLDCKNQPPLYWGLHNLTSLSSLAIDGCAALLSIPKGLLPMSIRKFYICDSPILQSIDDVLSDLTSLQHLCIRNCPMLAQQWVKKERENFVRERSSPNKEGDIIVSTVHRRRWKEIMITSKEVKILVPENKREEVKTQQTCRADDYY